MKIELGDKIYEATHNPNIFREYRLIYAELSKRELERKKAWLESVIALIEKPISIDGLTVKQRKIIEKYNKSLPKEDTFKKELDEINAILEKINGLGGIGHG